MNDKSNKNNFDNSELLRKAALDRQEYYNEIEDKKREERLEREANIIWEEEKRRTIIDIEDQIRALEATNRFSLNTLVALHNQNDENNNREIEFLKEKITINEHKITALRIDIDDILIKKRPK